MNTRSLQNILSDICIAFDTDVDSYLNRSRKSTDKMSLITQAFVFVCLETQCCNSREMSKIIKRTPAIITLMRKNVYMLITSNHVYATNFKSIVNNSCDEGHVAISKYIK